MYTVLIVEDDAAIATMLQEVLEMEGYTALATFDGRAALQLVPQVQPDLILSDIAMPQMDGYELYAAVRTLPQLAATPIILMTAWHNPALPAAPTNVTLLQKPLLPDVLLQTIRAVLEAGDQGLAQAVGQDRPPAP